VEELAWILVQIVAEAFGEVFLEVFLAGFKEAFGRTKPASLLAPLKYLALGAVLGGLSIWLYPSRAFRHRRIPGISLLIAPLVGGAVMWWWRQLRESTGHVVTSLATFWGGAALLFGYALVRLMWAR
jgi:hypothetical protein